MESTEPVGPPGVLVFRGSTFTVADLTISARPLGGFNMTSRPMVAWEIWPLWARIAIDELFNARVARRDLAAATAEDDGEKRAQLLEDETRSGLVAICAAAFALEAIAIAAARSAGVDAAVGRNASSARRVAEVLKQCFAVPPKMFDDWRQTMINVFDARNEAVHNDARSHDPAPHPGLRAGVPRPAAMYRTENSRAAVTLVLYTVTEVVPHPRPRRGRAFREKASAWTTMGTELADYAVDRRAAFEGLGDRSENPSPSPSPPQPAP